MDEHKLKSHLHPMTPQPTPLAMKGGLHRPIQCLLCDIYGTLLISGSGDIGISQCQDAEDASLNGLLAEYGIRRPPATLRQDLHDAVAKDHQRKRDEGIDYPEVKIEEIWATILPFGGEEKIRDFAARWEMVVNPVWPMPGFRALMAACRVGGVSLGIISNAQFYTPLMFELLLGAGVERLGFDRRLIQFSYQCGRAKPSPYLFAAAVDTLEVMGIAREQAAFIGNDMRNDIAPAHAAGLQTVLFAGDARSLRMRRDDPCCRDLQPDLRITHLNQLASFISNARPQTTWA
jgi:putative hydrolase of the HAD superfamily